MAALAVINHHLGAWPYPHAAEPVGHDFAPGQGVATAIDRTCRVFCAQVPLQVGLLRTGDVQLGKQGVSGIGFREIEAAIEHHHGRRLFLQRLEFWSGNE